MEESQEVKGWLTTIGASHAAAIVGGGAERPSNRLTKRLRIAAVLCRALGRRDWAEIARAGLARYVSEGLFAVGSSPDFKRWDTLRYHCSAVVPALDVAIALCEPGLYAQ